MMFNDAQKRAIGQAAARLGVEPAALAAVIEVESGGRVFATVRGRREPLIRFEGHYFDRRLTGRALQIARTAGLAHPKAGRIANPRDQTGRWAMLERAEAIDRRAARESCSYGCGQVMGAHWKALRFSSVDALVAEARRGLSGQIELMDRFIRHAGLAEPLRRRDFAAFARGYNGPAYRLNRYDEKMRSAHARWRPIFASLPAPDSDDAAADPETPILRRGAEGMAVRRLQDALRAAGAEIAVDGRFGPATEAALIAFQTRRGLAADGVAGPRSHAALMGGRFDPVVGGGLFRRIMSRIAAWLGIAAGRIGKMDEGRASR